MTNEMIVFNERCKLMEQNVIGTTGRSLEIMTADGSTVTMMEPEELHTFQAWKALGFTVKKGQKSIARFPVWKYAVKVKANEDGTEAEPEGRMFMKTACFFSASQVERIKF